MRNQLSCLLVLLCTIGCAAEKHLGRAPLVPPLAGEMPKADLSRDQGLRAAADLSPSVRHDMWEAPPESAATPPTYRTVVHLVETPVFVESPAADTTWTSDPGYADYDAYGYYERDRGGYSRPRGRGPFIPINTIVGAGIGAAIGNQSHRRHRGAWIGGSIGLLMDLDRWWR